MDILLDCLTDGASVMAKSQLKTLKMWSEAQFNITQHINLQAFTEAVCWEKQMKNAMANIKTKSNSDTGSSTKEKLRTFNDKCELWLNAKCELTAYLNQILNEDGVPISFIK